MGLNIYYVCISIYGFWQWKENRDKLKETTQPDNSRKDMILYSHITPLLFIKVCFSIAYIFLILYYILHHFTDSPIPVGDAFTTAVGIVATWMLAKQSTEHWFFWIIVNAVSIYLYYIRGLYPTMFLYICYGVLAIVGLYTWKKKGFKTDDTTL
jgi:nicotinamide mononucleotide transporter